MGASYLHINKFASCAGNTEVVAELLECGVEVDAIVDVKYMFTMLEISSANKQLELVRLLVQRGASADHMGPNGHDAKTLCWLKSDLMTRHSSMDILNVLSESTHIDLHHDENYRAQAVNLAAIQGCGAQIDSLVRFGYNIWESDFGPRVTISYAAMYGNYSAYSALVSHFGEDVFRSDREIGAYLLQDTISGSMSSSKAFSYGPHREYDEVLRDLLQRCGNDRLLSLTVCGLPGPDPDPRISALLGKEMNANELAAALGPETEAWYLGMVRSCGFLNVDEESEVMQRLRELSLAGHVTTGFVYEGEEEFDESGGRRECGNEDCDEQSALSGEDDAGMNGGDESSTESEADEADQFWDASENV
jgi:hypothetical protein